MEDKRILSSGGIVYYTDDPEAAKRLAVSGSCFISLPEVTDIADGYVRAREDFEDLSDAYLERLCMRHLKKPDFPSTLRALPVILSKKPGSRWKR